MTIREFKEKVYEEYKTPIDAILIASREPREFGEYKSDAGVATDKFIAFVENNEESLFVNVPEAKTRIAELKAEIDG